MTASILVVARWYPSFDRPGSGTFVADQVRALRDAGATVTVASFDLVSVSLSREGHAHIDAAESAWASVLQAGGALTTPYRWGAGVPVARLPVVKTWRSQAGAETMEIVARHARPFLAFGRAFASAAANDGHPIDAIHAHTGIPDGLIAMQLAEELGVGLVVSEHDSTLPERLADPDTRAAYLRLAESAQVTVVSHAFADRIQRALGPAATGDHRLVVVPNPVPMETFARGLGEPRDDDEMLFVGSRRPHKGIETLLRATAVALARHPRLHLRLIGASLPGDEATWISLAESLGIADRVRFEPETDRAGVAAAMRRAGMFVHPSPSETFGMVAAESLAAGLPVAATPSGGVDEILGTTGAGGEIAVDGTPEALADAIDRLRSRLSGIDRSALSEHVERRFSPSVVAARLLELHEVERGRARARIRPIPSVADDAVLGSSPRPSRTTDPSAFLVIVRRAEIAPRVRTAAGCGPLPTRVVGAEVLAVKRTPERPGLRRRVTNAIRRRVLRRPPARPPDPRIVALRSAWDELPDTGRVLIPVDLEDLETATRAFGDLLPDRLAPGSVRWLADRQDAAAGAVGR